MISLERLFFLGSYGILGILPLAQLKIAWQVLIPSDIGILFFVMALSMLIASLCDANVNFRFITNIDSRSLEKEIREAFCLRITRFVLFMPFIILLSILVKFDIYILVSTLLIVMAKLLSVSYIYRNSGSISLSVKWEIQLRGFTLMLPILTLWLYGTKVGLLMGCFTVFLIQMILVLSFFGTKILPIKLILNRSLDVNLVSAFIGVGYSNFSQVAAGLLLPSNTYAIFASFDKLVRACLIIVEPTRLLVLREANIYKKNNTVNLTIFGLFLSVICFILIFILFHSGLSKLIFETPLEQRFFILVASTTSFVSFVTVCIFIQQGFVKLMSYGLAIGMLIGIILFYFSMYNDIYTAVVIFELSVALSLLLTLFFIPSQVNRLKE